MGLFLKSHIGIFCALVFAFAYYLVFFFYTGLQLEDALITWRYSESIANGLGFVFNSGERVLGTTTPALTLLLAAGGFLFGSDFIPVISLILMSLCGLGTGLCLYLILLKIGSGKLVALIASILYLFNANVVWSTVGGMETPLVMFLMAFSYFSMLQNREKQAAFLTALLVMTRIDGVIWALVIISWILFRKREKSLGPALVFLFVILPWLCFAYLYFGSPIPHSMIAKSVIKKSTVSVFAGSYFQHFLFWILRYTGVSIKGGHLASFIFGTWFLTLVAGYRLLLARDYIGKAWPLLIFPPLFGLFFYFGKAPHFEWYLLPFSMAIIPIGAYGLFHLGRSLLNGFAQGSQKRPWYRNPGVVIILVPALLLLADGLKQNHFNLKRFRQLQQNEILARKKVGQWIEAHSNPEQRVAMEAIGYQGTFSRRRVIDLVGLISPQVVAIMKDAESPGAGLRELLAREKPDFLVLRSQEILHNEYWMGGKIFEQRSQCIDFMRQYGLVQQFKAPHPAWGEALRSIDIFKRMDTGTQSEGGGEITKLNTYAGLCEQHFKPPEI